MADGLVVQTQATSTTRPPSTPPTTPPATEAGSAAADTSQGLTDTASLPASIPPEMLGDQGPIMIPIQQQPPVQQPPTTQPPPTQPPPPPPAPRPVQARPAALVPWVRGDKIAENESPRPQDRLYLSFNFWDNLNASVNRRLGAGLDNLRVYRETFGLEKTFLDGTASIGLRLPLNTLTADGIPPTTGVTTTDIGDLSIILKAALWQDDATGRLFSAGLLVTAPTGPDLFAGTGSGPPHSTTLQPFVGYVWTLDRWYLHGFSALDIPTDGGEATLLYNDVGIGYLLYRTPEPDDFLTAIVPTLEVHVNTPLNHRGALRPDGSGTPDVVDLTLGSNFEFRDRTRLAVGVVTPVTGPKPFDFEVLAQFRMRF
jgi:hypothetical protein